jgi:hypothetical protein
MGRNKLTKTKYLKFSLSMADNLQKGSNIIYEKFIIKFHVYEFSD